MDVDVEATGSELDSRKRQRLAEIEELKDLDLITNVEYAEKRAKILDDAGHQS